MRVWSIQRKSLAGYTLILLIILVLGGIFISDYQGVIRSSAQRDQTYETLLTIEHILDDIYNGEIAKLGHLITPTNHFLQLSNDSRQKLKTDMGTLRDLVEHEPAQNDRVKSLAYMLMRDRGLTGASQTVRSGQEEIWLKQVNTLISEVISEEQRQFKGYALAQQQHMRLALFMGGILAGSIVLILSLLYLGLHREITAREKVEMALSESLEREQQARKDAEDSNRKKTRVLSFVSHDFKNPLSAIHRFTESLKSEGAGFSDRQLETLDYILAGVRQLRSMVTDILDRARIDEGHLMPCWSRVNLPSVLDDLMPLIDALAEPQRITVSTVIQDNLPSLRADPLFLRQILLNLISNAIKYNKPNGKVTLRIQETEDRQSIQMKIEDNGIGMSQEQVNQLFQAYYRADRQDAVEGTGLGLTFTKNLVDMLSGHITVDSTLSNGSVFTVTLPIEPEGV